MKWKDLGYRTDYRIRELGLGNDNLGVSSWDGSAVTERT